MISWDSAFTTPRIGLLQPGLTADELDKPVERSSEKLVLESYKTTVRLWADAHPELPLGRLEASFAVTSAGRQPVAEIRGDTQIVERHITQRTEPGRRDSVDTRELPDGTPLTLIPLETPTFPESPQTSEHRLPGGESLHPCGGCNATGHRECNACGQTGRVVCSTCNAQKRLRCGGCGGNGRRVLPNGVIVHCTACTGAGAIVYTACDADANVRCSRCNGRGYNTCGTCDGFARVCRYHVLISQVSTATERVFHFSEEWPVELESLVGDMQDIWGETVTLESSEAVGGITSFDTDFYSPPVAHGVLTRLQRSLRLAVARGAVDDLTGVTASAVRFRIRGCYVHRVGYSLDRKDSRDCIYVGGLSNRLAPGSIQENCRSSTAWIQRPFHKLLVGVGLVESTGPTGRFKKRLKETGGKVHLLDTRAVVADAGEALGLVIEVGDYGYTLVDVDGIPAAEVELTHDQAQENLIVGFVAKLGEARRDKFVEALEFNASLVFGRVGLAMNSTNGKLEFGVYDTRLYDDLTADFYAAVLRYLLHAAIPKARSRLGG